MSSHRHVSFKGRLIWFLLIPGTWLLMRHALVDGDTLLFDHLGHRYGQWAEDEHAQLVLPGEEVKTEPHTVEQRNLLCKPVGTLVLDDATCREHFAALPLGPQDLAVLLNRMQQDGVATVGISSPLIWPEEAGDMTRQLLCKVLTAFRNPVLGLRGRTAAQAEFTPIILRDHAIPDAQVQGDTTGLPSANRTLPNGLTQTPDSFGVPWAPDWLQDEPMTQLAPDLQTLSFPLLVRWNGQTIPTLPLRLALAHAGLSPRDVHVTMGESIRIGERTLPLDEHGRTRLHEGLSIPVNLAELGGEGGGLRKQFGERSCVLIEQPAGLRGDANRLTQLARTLSQLVGEEQVHYTTVQRPIGGKVLYMSEAQQGGAFLAWGVGALVLALLVFPHLPWLLSLPAAFSLLGLIGWWALRAMAAGTWVSLSAALLCWAIFLLSCLFLRARDDGYFERKHGERKRSSSYK